MGPMTQTPTNLLRRGANVHLGTLPISGARAARYRHANGIGPRPWAAPGRGSKALRRASGRGSAAAAPFGAARSEQDHLDRLAGLHAFAVFDDRQARCRSHAREHVAGLNTGSLTHVMVALVSHHHAVEVHASVG